MVVAPVLPRFTQSYPEIVVEILIDPALTNIVAQRFDAGIRLGESLEKDVVAVPVTDSSNRLVGAVTIDDVLDHMLPADWRIERASR